MLQVASKLKVHKLLRCEAVQFIIFFHSRNCPSITNGRKDGLQSRDTKVETANWDSLIICFSLALLIIFLNLTAKTCEVP